ncbi:hypothetical protein GF395_04630 [Candidatus Uhrbacteria bacterium]|nr:hypothetical protein [Candidatus Uhrbacteria bacterium]
MARKSLAVSILLLALLPLALLGTSAPPIHAAGSPSTSTPTPSQPGDGAAALPSTWNGAAALPFTWGGPGPLELSLSILADGTWEGQAYVYHAHPRSTSPDSTEALDTHMQREAAAIFSGYGVSYTGGESRPRNGYASYALSLKGDHAREIVDIALRAGNAVKRLAGPVALDLRGDTDEGQVLEIALTSNPSTGYAWAVEALEGHPPPRVYHVEMHQVSKGLGGPARQALQLGVAKAGRTGFRLLYQRPWETGRPPAILISVQAQGLDLASACRLLSTPPPPRAAADVSGSKPEFALPEHAPPRSAPPPSTQDAQDLPTTYNWCEQHGCTPVKDQGQCGSCWAFGTVGPLEARLLMAEGSTTDLSEQYLLSCNTHGWSCSGGWWAHDYHLNRVPPSETQAGAVLESVSPYRALDLPCAGPYNHPHRITSWAYVGGGESVPSTAAIKQAIHTYGPVAAAICVGDAFRNYNGGIFQTDESCSNEVNHAIVLVGWDESQQAWILRNSWGPDWGEDGYMRIRYGTSNVGFSANYVVYTRPLIPSVWSYLPLVTRNSGSVYALSNGGFESGRDGSWSEYSSNGWNLILSASDLPTSVSPHGGTWAVWLGGDDDETSILAQQVTIPSDATHLTYWYWSASEDFCGYDYAYVGFGTTLLKSHSLCESNDTDGWVSQQVDVTGWRGQTVELRFTVATDGSLNSNFFLDDVSVPTAAAPP